MLTSSMGESEAMDTNQGTRRDITPCPCFFDQRGPNRFVRQIAEFQTSWLGRKIGWLCLSTEQARERRRFACFLWPSWPHLELDTDPAKSGIHWEFRGVAASFFARHSAAILAAKTRRRAACAPGSRHPQTSMGLNSATSFSGFNGLPKAASQEF